MSQHFIIVGGGVIGMLTARELQLAGSQVTLIERNQPGQESSWAGGGIISPLFPWRYLDSINHLAHYSQAHYPQLCAELAHNTGIDPEFTRSGMLMIAADEMHQAQAWAAQHQRNLAFIDGERYQALEPAADIPPEQAIWMPEVGQIRNPRLIKSLQLELARRQITLLTHTPVTGLIHQGDACRGVITKAGPLYADGVVICAGAWSQTLLKETPLPPDIWPVRGQMLLFKTEPGIIQRIVLEKNRYIIPRRDGRVLFGSTMETVGFDPQTTQTARDELHEIALTRFPVLAKYPIERHWAGLRPASPAGVPYISRHPEIRNLYVNAGQYRNGIVLGLASARLTADLMTNRSPILDPKPYGWTIGRG